MEIDAFTWKGLNEQRQELGKELQETPFFKMQMEEDRKALGVCMRDFANMVNQQKTVVSLWES